jgi:glyoxylase-like metal-dependent hydrolase (beta-lactamase superfamily II)
MRGSGVRGETERRSGARGGTVSAAGHEPAAEQRITVTGTVQQRAWRDRVLPPVERVRPGLWSVPTPFTSSPLRYVLSYLIETPKGPVLVDTGWPSDDAWDGLVDGIRETGHDVGDVVAVLVTHFHADHSGLAQRVREASGAWIGMHEADARSLARFASVTEFAAADRTWLTLRGVPPAEIDGMWPSADTGPGGGPGGGPGAGTVRQFARPDVLIADGDRPLGAATPLRAVWTPGHTPGHLCFADERYDVLLTGDHVLPRISPNISPSPLNDSEDALGSYLDSLAGLTEAEPEEVLPAHEYRFRGLAVRVAQLQAHHRARLGEVLEVIAARPGCTTSELAASLTWSRPWDQARGIVRRSAIGETYAHLIHLQRRGLISNAAEDAGPALTTDSWLLRGPAVRLPFA